MEEGIYVDLRDGNFHYFDNSKEHRLPCYENIDYYLNIKNVAKKIILVSPHLIDYKVFPAWDEEKKYRSDIKRLIREYRYKPLNEPMAQIIAEQYSICPKCGKKINIDYFIENSKCPVNIDVGLDLKNLFRKEFLVGLDVKCKCNSYEEYIYNHDISNNEQLLKEKYRSRPLYIKFRYIINDDKMSYIPVLIYIKDLWNFFDRNNLDKGLKHIAQTKTSKEILRVFFDKTQNREINEIKVMFFPIKYPFSRFSSKEDYELIKEYEDIGSDQSKLMEFFIEKLNQ